MSDALIPLEEIERTRARIGPHVRRTPTIGSRSLSERLGTTVHLKLELFQRTGSFKPRGAFAQVLDLDEDARRRGVVGWSGGNFAQGLALAGRELGVDTVIVMPETTPENYLEATRGYGATIDLVPDLPSAMDAVERHRAEGRTFLHPFDDPVLQAGHGSLGVEIVEDVPTMTDLVVSIGGGGLLRGVGSAVRALRPDVRIWGVETEGADAMRQALDAGEPVEIEITSIAKTLGAPQVTETTLAAAEELLEDVVVVSDRSAVRELRYLMERAKIVPEPAASCTVAAGAELADRLGSSTVFLICGGNVAVRDIAGWLDRFRL